MNYQALNQDEKTKLVTIILESIGTSVDFDEFEEAVGLMCEDIPGLEFLSEEDFSALVIDCWEVFRQTLLSYAGNQ